MMGKAAGRGGWEDAPGTANFITCLALGCGVEQAGEHPRTLGEGEEGLFVEWFIGGHIVNQQEPKPPTHPELRGGPYRLASSDPIPEQESLA